MYKRRFITYYVFAPATKYIQFLLKHRKTIQNYSKFSANRNRKSIPDAFKSQNRDKNTALFTIINTPCNVKQCQFGYRVSPLTYVTWARVNQT